MPSSDPENITLIVETVRQLNPQSILDLGCGYGKYGVLFREYLEPLAFHDQLQWTRCIDAIEGFPDIITPIHNYVYNHIHTENFLATDFESLQRYDLYFLGDSIEHVTLDEGTDLINRLLALGGKVLISTPDFPTNYNKTPPLGNKLDVHKCRWRKRDFAFRWGRRATVLSKPRARLLTVLIA